MKRPSLILCLLGVAVVAPLQGQVDDCITDKKCPDGSEPPACCAPPPCEIEEAMTRARAGRRMHDTEWADIIQAQLGDTSKARSVYLSVMDDFESFKNCEDAKHPQAQAPDLSSDCQIGFEASDGFRPLSKEEFIREANTCTELAEAAWDRTAARQRICVAIDAGERSSLAGMIHEGAAAYAAEVETLEKFMASYWGACSSTRSIFQLSDETIDRALKTAPRSGPPRRPARVPRTGSR